MNAAIGLARQQSTAGLPVFKEILKKGDGPVADPGVPAQVEELLSLKNVLHAVRILDGQWTPAQRTELTALIDPLSRNHAEPRIRTDANDCARLAAEEVIRTCNERQQKGPIFDKKWAQPATSRRFFYVFPRLFMPKPS